VYGVNFLSSSEVQLLFWSKTEAVAIHTQQYNVPPVTNICKSMERQLAEFPQKYIPLTDELHKLVQHFAAANAEHTK